MTYCAFLAWIMCSTSIGSGRATAANWREQEMLLDVLETGVVVAFW